MNTPKAALQRLPLSVEADGRTRLVQCAALPTHRLTSITNLRLLSVRLSRWLPGADSIGPFVIAISVCIRFLLLASTLLVSVDIGNLLVHLGCLDMWSRYRPKRLFEAEVIRLIVGLAYSVLLIWLRPLAIRPTNRMI